MCAFTNISSTTFLFVSHTTLFDLPLHSILYLTVLMVVPHAASVTLSDCFSDVSAGKRRCLQQVDTPLILLLLLSNVLFQMNAQCAF